MLQRVKENKTLQFVLFGIVLYLNLLALCHVDHAKGLGDDAAETIAPIFYAIGTGMMLTRFMRVRDRRRKIVAVVGGVLLAFSYVYGTYLHYINDLFMDAGQVLFLLLVVAGVSITTVPLFSLLFEGMEKAGAWYADHRMSETEQKISKKVFLKYWLGILGCYIPVFLAYWPVNFVYDAKYQLREVINNDYRIHHPLLHTWLMGATYNWGGEVFGSVSVGISFYTIIQMVICSMAFAYVLWYLYKQRVPKVLRVAGFLFFAVFPMNSILAISATKDVLFAAFYAVFFVTLLRIADNQESMTKGIMFLLVVSGVLMLLFRKNAVYALIVAIPFLVGVTLKKKRKIMLTAALVATIVLAHLSNEGLIQALQASGDDGLREASSIFVQSMARVADYRGEELAPELYEEMLLYWEDGFEEVYNPYISDPIKNAIDGNLLEANFINFLKLWVKIGLQFPGEYVESFLTNNIAYWYMGDLAHAMAAGDDISLYHMLIGTGEEIVKKNYCPPASMLLDSLFVYGKYRETPILACLFRPSTYLWLFLAFILYAIYKREYRSIMVYSLSVLYVGTCLFGPWGVLRYIYAIVVTVPLIMHTMLKPKSEK